MTDNPMYEDTAPVGTGADNTPAGAVSLDSLAHDLLLRCGRYIPDPAADAEARAARMEDYLAALSEELETLLPMLCRVLSDMADAVTDASAAAASDGEE